MGLVVGKNYIEMVLRDYYTANVNSIELVEVNVTTQSEPDVGLRWIITIADASLVDAKKAFYGVSVNSNDAFAFNVMRYNSDGTLTVVHRFTMKDSENDARNYPIISLVEDVSSIGASRFVTTSNFTGINYQIIN